MPIIRVEMLEGRSDEQRKNLAAALTEAMVKTVNIDASHIHVVIQEVPAKNWAFAGTTFAEAPPHKR
ncbi:MAG: 4-oxalocrotonate tautomerase family protein [Candidatus Tectomicrobia bacterium]|nr:4-oxalocrotonate tautomerase family protein [Candidatus Tectomicrobia bacterium]